MKTAEQIADELITKYGPMPRSEELYRAILEMAAQAGIGSGIDRLSAAMKEQTARMQQTQPGDRNG